MSITSVPSSSSINNENAKQNLLGLPKAKLEAFFESLGEKRFRAAQVLKWVHQLGVTDFEQMTNISKPLRQKLSEVAEIQFPAVLQRLDSKAVSYTHLTLPTIYSV